MSKMVKRRFEEMDLAIRNTQAMVIDHEERIIEISESVQRQTRLLGVGEPLLFTNSIIGQDGGRTSATMDLMDIEGTTPPIYCRNLVRFCFPNNEINRYRIVDGNVKDRTGQTDRAPFKDDEHIRIILVIKRKLLIILVQFSILFLEKKNINRLNFIIH